MPTYEYVCAEGGFGVERVQSMRAKPSRKCPECGKFKLQRLSGSGAGIIFKGSGFYETDYRSESYKKGAEGEKKASETKKPDSEKETKKGNDTPASKTEKSRQNPNLLDDTPQ